ncbi:hypothetical protein NQ318_013645 [Aromia moschata]|uniref:Uncharacterized protein n=1 Tax=Aromia moschata TaxID=1265417 RepID=A0AAV8Y1U6_9CUCU|nr:hypothetical protein NQ318_013645 [Aromia moschata]
MVPKLLISEQKESRLNICADILNNIDTDPGLLDMLNDTELQIDNINVIIRRINCSHSNEPKIYIT